MRIVSLFQGFGTIYIYVYIYIRIYIYIYIDTLPESKIAPENRPLEKEIPIGKHHFQVLC